MSILFEPMVLGKTQIKNRFVHSATFERMTTERGEITEALVKRYRTLAKGEVGLIIPGFMYVHPLGRSYKYQTGICDDSMIPGLKRMVEAVHQEGGKIVFQLVHAGRQTTKALIGKNPLGPSSINRDPVYFIKPKEMTENDIYEVIQSFVKAAQRAIEAGADGVQLHAAHGYLINQFLSPFFNQRKDAWGGSVENRFRFLKEIILEVRKILSAEKALLIKLNSHDYTPKQGITPDLAAKYAQWSAELGIDGLEISCGTVLFSIMNSSRGDVPIDDFVEALPWWKKPLGKLIIKSWIGKYNFEGPYNLDAAKCIKPLLGKVPLLLVGGIRKVPQMEEIIQNGNADFISMSRPFIREPLIVKKIKEGKTKTASCVSCNRCLAALNAGKAIRCCLKAINNY